MSNKIMVGKNIYINIDKIVVNDLKLGEERRKLMSYNFCVENPKHLQQSLNNSNKEFQTNSIKQNIDQEK